MQSDFGALRLNFPSNVQQRPMANSSRSVFVPECNSGTRNSNPNLFLPEGAFGDSFIRESNRIRPSDKFGHEEIFDSNKGKWQEEAQSDGALHFSPAAGTTASREKLPPPLPPKPNRSSIMSPNKQCQDQPFILSETGMSTTRIFIFSIKIFPFGFEFTN